MSATAFKNAVRRREHRERSQPAARAKYGLLEKHGDYVQRARHFHDKEKRIAALRAKADNRNRDEFYHKMAHGKTKKGVHSLGREGTALTADALQSLKTQDLTYLNSKKVAEERKIERLQSSLHAISAAAPRSHLVFEEAASDAPVAQAAAHRNDSDEEVNEGAGEPPFAASKPLSEEERAAHKKRKRIDKLVDASYVELGARIDRAEKIGELAARIELSKQLLRKGRRVKLAVEGADGEKVTAFRWKPQRAR
jgi:U3 small nucleolar RNA-associated protein 11